MFSWGVRRGFSSLGVVVADGVSGWATELA
jgi:hypothetical protein